MKIPLSRVIPPMLLSIAFVAPAWAQGSDDCSTPTMIAGQGDFAFDSTTATTGSQGQNESLCNQFGTTGIDHDVWFVWTAPATGFATVSLCNTVAFDSKIAAYSGSGCPVSPALACNDDSCGVQSVIGFDVTVGQDYTLQIGSFPGAGGGSGTFNLSVGDAPPACGTNTGPDVIVGDLTDVLNANPVGGIDALAIGTTSCNIGTAVVNWLGGTNDHPVIRQNLYRYSEVNGAGRFEQVGLSWLKHGFASLQGSLCCTCQPGGDGSHLGVGCSDPYDAGLNGSQSGLGPNWQVNAHTGVFTYPPANPSHPNDTIYRRLQVALSDLSVTGGTSTTRFFGECQYVTKDDATAGNQNNNASWRQMSVTGSATNYDLQLTGMTHRAESAIRAWAAIDSNVNLDDLQIQGDGLVVLGTRATDLGGGQWHYEYAVYNMNADRNIGSVSIPLAPGVTVSNVAFHDVRYHDNDGNGNVTFSGADWTVAQTSAAITWSTETQAANNNANAIRWGTLYNFRFDANTAPQSGSITLGIWKPGSPDSISGTGDVPGAGGAIAAFCFGDGTVAACPCSNSGVPEHGCDNSSGTGGSILAGSGTPSLSADTLSFSVTGERPTAFSVFFQGDAEISPVLYGDGLRCTGGSIVRLYSKNASGGAASAPTGSELPVSQRSAALGAPILPTDTRIYQVLYRDPDPSFCPMPTGSTFNASNGLRVTWGP
jgi:hypothetical protein